MLNEFIEHYNHMRCPYCNSEITEHIDSLNNEEKRICRNCGNDYLIEYADDTQDVITYRLNGLGSIIAFLTQKLAVIDSDDRPAAKSSCPHRTTLQIHLQIFPQK